MNRLTSPGSLQQVTALVHLPAKIYPRASESFLLEFSLCLSQVSACRVRIICKLKSSKCLQALHLTAQRMIQRKQFPQGKVIICWCEKAGSH